MATLALPTDQPSLLDLIEEERAAPSAASVAPAAPAPVVPAAPSVPAAPAVAAAPVAAPAPAAPAPAAPVAAPRVDQALVQPFGERTLEDLVLGAWEELAVVPTSSCPLCSGPLLPRFGAGARPVGARCSDCSTELT
jgi:hypothetical protein